MCEEAGYHFMFDKLTDYQYGCLIEYSAKTVAYEIHKRRILLKKGQSSSSYEFYKGLATPLPSFHLHADVYVMVSVPISILERYAYAERMLYICSNCLKDFKR